MAVKRNTKISKYLSIFQQKECETMPKKSTDIAKLSNAFSTGSGGANFERHVQAIFVLSLIIDGFTPIIDVPVKRLDFQAKHQGYDVDDLLVVGSNPVRQVKLLCQIKHSLSVTNSDRTFQEVITAAWSDFNKPSFNQDYDRIALITGFIAKDSINALRYIHDQAIAASNESAFIQRMNMANYTSTTCLEKFNVIRTCITRVKNSTVSDIEIWRFCRCFILAVFDVDYKCSVNRILASSLIHCKSDQDALLVWNRLSDQCGIWNQQAATVTADNMPYDILELFNCKKPIVPLYSASVNFPANDIWSKITLIGCWDERNEYDIKAIEELTQMQYGQFQNHCREILISNPQLLTFKNGIWKSLKRESAFENIREFYFDETIDRAFQIATTYLTEISKQITEDGQFDIVIPDSGRFNNSDGFRSALLTGLCMLANGPQLVHCSDNIFTAKSNKLIQNILVDADWKRLVSISDYINCLAELNPSSFLENLEKLTKKHPEEVTQLFPRKNNIYLVDRNFISSILFSLERLAWIEDYLVASIRCLGELEALNYEETNWANTPINTIIKILSPFYPQTCASIDKQKNALNGLKIDHPELYWSVITKLLPHGISYSTTGTARPLYIKSDIPNEIFLADDERVKLFYYYIQQAIAMSDSNVEKLIQLTEHTEYMGAEDLIKYLDTVKSSSVMWKDEQKCDLWIKLCELKYETLHENPDLEIETPQYATLCETIESICPQSILYRHKRLYLSHLNEFVLGKEHWEELDTQKTTAVKEIYNNLGLPSVIDFGISVDALYDVGNRLGKCINIDELKTILLQYQEGNHIPFFSSLMRSFLYQNGLSSIEQLDLLSYNPEFIATLLKDAPFEQALIDLVPKYLPENESLFWESVAVPQYYPGYSDYSLKDVINTLLSYNRAPAAITALGYNIDAASIESSLLFEILLRAPAEGSDQIHQYTVRKIIAHLQNVDGVDIETLSGIEYIYLPWLDQYSPVKPKAINYKLANEADCFCKLMEATYKKRHDQSKKAELSKAVSERLFKLTFKYSVIPGVDWDGSFHEDKFVAWIEEVKNWAKDNDRYEVSMHTIGNGLSYAKFNASDTIEPAIMKELNAADNDELRKGYKLGIFNQRGAHWVDPEGKPERALAEKFSKRAEAVEHLGYSRFADTLRSISDDYLAEAEDNARWNEKQAD